MRIIIATLLLLLISVPTHADMVWHDSYKSPLSSWSAYMYDQNVKRHLRERTTGAAKPATRPPPRAKIEATDFKRNARGTDVVAQYVAATKVDEAVGAELSSALRQTMAQIAAMGRKDNVATAMAAVIALSYVVLEKPDFDISKANDLIPVVNDALAASPQFRKLRAAERQAMYDSLLLSAAVIALVHQAGEKEQSQTIARQVLQQLIGLRPS